MHIRDFMDLEKLQRIQDDFSDATGLAAIAVDAEGNYITEGSNFTDFCMKYTRGCAEGARRCTKCDNECTGVYFCHAGLMDFASDIVVEGERLGAIIGGQVLPSEPDEDKFRQTARELGINEDEYVNALRKVNVRTEKSIRAAAGMLGMVVNEMVNLEYIKFRNASRIDGLDAEIQACVDVTNVISNKTHELKSIASKQKMLALNASIEAARTGEAGVGFAVVAKSMGDLSSKSAVIYNDIETSVTTVSESINRLAEFFKK